MASLLSCCTCASVLSIETDAYDPKTEKPIRHRTLSCCGRRVCALCIEKNPRFQAYCPFCQTTRLPPSQQPIHAESSKARIDSPPPYSLLSPTSSRNPTPPPAPRPRHATLSFSQDERPISPLPPPPYQVSEFAISAGDGSAPTQEPCEDVTHYLSTDDSIQSISLAYRVPAHVLKAHNSIHSDHLLSARRKISIPASHYQGPSLSPFALEDPEEQERKSKIRKLMVKCKVAEYKVAVMYLEEAAWDLEAAEAKVEADDRWEREHPVSGSRTILHSSMPRQAASPYQRQLRLAEPMSSKRIANLLS